MESTTPSVTGTHRTSVVRLQSIYLPTIYEFLPQGQVEIITAFHNSDEIGSAKCSYNPAEHMFEIQCVPIHSINAANVLLRVQKDFIEREAGQRRAKKASWRAREVDLLNAYFRSKSSSLKVKRMAAANINHEDLDDTDSLTDDSLPSQDDSTVKAGQPTFKTQWRPANSSVGLAAVATGNVLQRLSKLTDCIISVDEAMNSLVIRGYDIEQMNKLEKKLCVIEKIVTGSSVVGHVAEVEGDTTKIKVHFVRVADVDDGTMGRLLLHEEFDMFRRSDSKLTFPDKIGAKLIPRHSRYNVGKQDWNFAPQKVSPIAGQTVSSSTFRRGLVWYALRQDESRPYPSQVLLETPPAPPSGVAVEKWLHGVDDSPARSSAANYVHGDTPKYDPFSEVAQSNTWPTFRRSSQLLVQNSGKSPWYEKTPPARGNSGRGHGFAQTNSSRGSQRGNLTRGAFASGAAPVIPRTREETPPPQTWGNEPSDPFSLSLENPQDSLIDFEQQPNPWTTTGHGETAETDDEAQRYVIEQIRRDGLRNPGKKILRTRRLVDITMPTIVDETSEGLNDFQELQEGSSAPEREQGVEMFGNAPTIPIDPLQPVIRDRMLPSEEEEVTRRVFRPTHRYQKPTPKPKGKNASTKDLWKSAAMRNLKAAYEEEENAPPLSDKSTTSQSAAGSVRLRRPFEELPPTTSLGQLIDGCTRSFDRARLFTGDVEIAMQIGQILLPKQAIGQDDPRITLTQFAKSWADIQGFDTETGCFTRMVTSSTSDILSLLARVGKSNDSQAGAPRAWFEFTCSTADKQEVIMRIDALESQEQQPYLVCGKNLLGVMYLHFPQKTFDGRLVIRVTEKEPVESMDGAKALLDNLQIKILDNGLPSVRGQESPVFQVKKLRLHVQSTYDIAGFNETAYLQITQVQDLQIIHPLQNQNGAFAADLEDDQQMIEDGSLWYELCIMPVDPPAEFEENKTLEYGEEASWTTASVMSDNMKYKVRQMEELTRRLIFSMEGVGYYNIGPAAEREKQMRTKKAERAAKADEFW